MVEIPTEILKFPHDAFFPWIENIEMSSSFHYLSFNNFQGNASTNWDEIAFFSSEIRKQRWNPSRQSCLDLGVVSQAWRHFFKKKIATEKTNFSSSSNFLWEQNQLYINGCFLHTKLWYGWYGFISFIQWVIHHR